VSGGRSQVVTDDRRVGGIDKLVFFTNAAPPREPLRAACRGHGTSRSRMDK
jgi:hypothetical protein